MRETSCRLAYSDTGLLPGAQATLIYRATKSSFEIISDVVVDGSCVGQLEHTPSWTMLAQDGAAQESWGSAGRVESFCWVSLPLVSRQSTPTEGAPASAQPAYTCLLPVERGKQGGGGMGCCADPSDCPATSSTREEGLPPLPLYDEGRRQVAFLVVGLTDPLNKRREEERSSHHWG